jgi:hypothetical protein
VGAGFLLLVLLGSCDKLPFTNPCAARVGLRFLLNRQVYEKTGGRSSEDERNAYIEQWIEDEVGFRAAKKTVRLDASMRRQVRDYRRQLIIRKYYAENLQPTAAISENAVLEYYKKHMAAFRTPVDAAFVELYASPISETANEIHRDLKSGKRPAQIPEFVLIRSGECTPVFERALFAKRTNGLIAPQSERNQHYVISVIEYFPKDSQLRVEHVREEIIQRLQIEAQMQRYQEQQKALKERFNVKIY